MFGARLRYTPLSTKELLETYTNQTVDSCERHFYALLFIHKALYFFFLMLQIPDKHSYLKFLYTNSLIRLKDTLGSILEVPSMVSYKIALR